jgi:hypothetical protein
MVFPGYWITFSSTVHLRSFVDSLTISYVLVLIRTPYNCFLSKQTVLSSGFYVILVQGGYFPLRILGPRSSGSSVSCVLADPLLMILCIMCEVAECNPEPGTDPILSALQAKVCKISPLAADRSRSADL